METSLSDNKEYPDFCNLAVREDNIFKSFRRNQVFCGVVETLTYKQGLQYLKVIISQTPELIDRFDDFRKNDLYGEPIIYDYGEYGKFAPTTLRYIKVLSDFNVVFGDLKNMNIVEIGGGYGGLCRIISDFFNIDSYTIVDLKSALNLAEKYLLKYEVKNVKYKTADDLSQETNYDLVISNYAFSECRKPVQEIYFKKIIKNSSRGYITWNFIINETELYSYSIKEFSQKITKPLIMASMPHPFSVSKILFWGNVKKFNKLSLFYFNFSSKLKNIPFFLFNFYYKLKVFLQKRLPGFYLLILSLKRYLFYPEIIAQNRKSLELYSRFIKNGDLCFDVGANIGNKTSIFLRLGARVVAIEPQSVYHKIQELYGGNKNLIVVNKGLADKEGKKEMSISDDGTVISTMSENWKEKGRFSGKYKLNKKQIVNVATLDNLIAEYGVPKFCKIDVEGFEEEVLKGLTRPIPYISFEFVKEFLDDAKRCVNYLMSLGPARFNFSIEESAELFFKDWVLPDELFLELNKIEDNNLWGDIYVKF